MVENRKNLIKESVTSAVEEIIGKLDALKKTEEGLEYFTLRLVADKECNKIEYDINTSDNYYTLENICTSCELTDYMYVLIGELILEGFSTGCMFHCDTFVEWTAHLLNHYNHKVEH